MTNPLHQTAPLGEIHSPVNWSFASTTLRRAVGPYVLTDLGGECMQTDTSPPTFWKLVAITSPGLTATPTWRQITTVADPIFSGDFGAIFTAQGLTVDHYLRSDLGLHKTGSIVNSWDAQIGPTITEITSGVGIGTAGTGLGGFASIDANSTTQGGTYTLALPAPTSSVGVFMWDVVQVTTIPSGTSALDSDGGFRLTTTFNSTPSMTLWDGANGNVPAATGVWACAERAFDNTAASYGKFGAGAATTGSFGSTAGAGTRYIFCTASANFLGAKLLAKVTCRGTLANYAIAAAAAKTAAQSFYGGSVT